MRTRPGTRHRFRPQVESLEDRQLLSSTLLLLPSPAVSSRVVALAEQRLGVRVGDGQCTALVLMALLGAGAVAGPGPWGPNDDYVWGSLVLKESGRGGGGRSLGGSLADLQPGDVVQLRDARFTSASPTGHSRQLFSHHTLIIEAALGSGRFRVLQQNFNGNMTVQRGVIDFTQMRQGTAWVYCPVAPATA
jgi:hypothetical protein